jgi:hypothetical protein
MKFRPKADLLLNIVLPLWIGVLIYWATDRLSVPPLVRNYLPDACWGYSLMSATLWVWQRRIVLGWVLAVFGLAVGFETLQYYHFIDGTGDLGDIAVYFVSFGLALAFNPIYEKQYKTSPVTWRSRPLRGVRPLFKGQ